MHKREQAETWVAGVAQRVQIGGGLDGGKPVDFLSK